MKMIRGVWWENQIDQHIFFEWVLNAGRERLCLLIQAVVLAMETRNPDGDKELPLKELSTD